MDWEVCAQEARHNTGFGYNKTKAGEWYIKKKHHGRPYKPGDALNSRGIRIRLGF